VKTTLNRWAVMQSLDGKHKVALAKLGITRADGAEQFYIEPVEQAGTIATA
jgi:phage host-nuclease inhibitor protein Gam